VLAHAFLWLQCDGLQDGPASVPPSPSGEDGDFVLEFEEELGCASPGQLGAAAMRALQEIRNAQLESQRSLADQVGWRTRGALSACIHFLHARVWLGGGNMEG
jgi:hypothetical protein